MRGKGGISKMIDGYVPVYVRTRAGKFESVHYGAGAALDSSGNLLFAFGDPHLETFIRSTAKPLQALPLVEAGGLDRFGLNDKELALICASHTGTDAHVEILLAIQAKTGVLQSDLKCGIHPPIDKETRSRLATSGEAPTPNRHNCSGKHTGMLAFARMSGWPTESYLDPEHPVQTSILAALADMASVPAGEITVGTDGCSAPNFALPLFNTALAYARMVDPIALPGYRAQACRTITGAMSAHPHMVAGREEFDTRLMEAAGGSIISKGGAEGYQGIGWRPPRGERAQPGIGIALKISDGDPGGKVRAALVLEILRSMGALSASQMHDLAGYGPQRSLKNYREIETGVGKPTIDFASILPRQMSAFAKN